MAAPWAKIAAHSPFLLVNGALSSHTGLQSLPLKSVLIYCQRRFDTSLNQRCNAHLMRLRKRGQIYLFGSPTASWPIAACAMGSNRPKRSFVRVVQRRSESARFVQHPFIPSTTESTIE